MKPEPIAHMQDSVERVLRDNGLERLIKKLGCPTTMKRALEIYFRTLPSGPSEELDWIYAQYNVVSLGSGLYNLGYEPRNVLATSN